MDEYDSTNRYCDKTLPQLKDILRERNLKVTGKKKDLIERLLFHDRNAQIQEPVPEFHMSLPEAILYKDLHNDHLQNFPNVTRRRLLDFLASCDKSFDDKIEMLYQQRYLRCVRVATKDGNTFITSVVWAEMKKATTYKVDLSLDSHGVVLETQCECAVGQGPSAHCKHIICVLYGLTKYCTDGSILTEVTCTQVLQTFHRSKPQKGSPLKSKHLSQARGKTKPILYDPRPINKRSAAKAEQMLRSTVLNWQGKSKWPVLQKYASANLRALASDHDYMELTWEEHFLKEEKLVGLGGLGAGVWLMLKDFNAREVTALIGVNMFEIASYLLIAGGGVVSLLAFCGCCGTMKEDRCVLGFYATTLTLMLVMLVSGSVIAFLSKEYLADKLQDKFKNTIAKKYGVDIRTKTENRLITDAWDSVQKEMECCGVHGNVSGEYSWQLYKTESQWYVRQKSQTPYVPESCCKKDADIGLCIGTKEFEGPPRFTVKLQGRKNNPHLSTDGCYEKIVEKIGEHALIIGLVSAAIPIFLIVGVVVSCCLCFKVEKDPDDGDDDFYDGEPV